MLEQESIQNINLTPGARNHIKSLGVWMRVASIIKLILIVLFALISLIALIASGSQIAGLGMIPGGVLV